MTAPDHDLRGVLQVPAFRKLWTALSLSSFGDWLGLLALTALAPRLADGSYAAANLAIAGVFILRLAPAIVMGPLGGVIADRLDRRLTMVVCDVARFALFLSIPIVGTLWWLLTATFLIEAASLIWIPAKEATLPNIVPRERLETANQLSLFTTYGSAPVAAAVFAGLALVSGMLDNAVSSIDEVDLALFFNSATFLVSALTILAAARDPEARAASPPARNGRACGARWSTGGGSSASSRLVRGLVFGMLGASAAGGAVVGLARTFVTDLGAGDPGYGLVFGTVFLGLAGGMFFGPRLVPDFSRRRHVRTVHRRGRPGAGGARPGAQHGHRGVRQLRDRRVHRRRLGDGLHAARPRGRRRRARPHVSHSCRRWCASCSCLRWRWRRCWRPRSGGTGSRSPTRCR